MAIMAIMIGIQASGKTSFCKSHLQEYTRINLDELHTRNKEWNAITEAIQNGENIVVDNTNPTKEDRQKYISLAQKHNYEIVGYFMQSKVKDCIDRNAKREGKACVPNTAIACTSNKLEVPEYAEGFNKLFFISIIDKNFKIDDWRKDQ